MADQSPQIYCPFCGWIEAEGDPFIDILKPEKPGGMAWDCVCPKCSKVFSRVRISPEEAARVRAKDRPTNGAAR